MPAGEPTTPAPGPAGPGRSRPGDVEACGDFADALLSRVVAGSHRHVDDPLAALRVSDTDADRLVGELGTPLGGTAGRPDDVALLRTALHDRLPVHTAVGRLRAAAGLTDTETEVLAVLLAVAVDPRRGRLLAWLNDDVLLRVVTVGSVTALFGGDREAALAAGPGSGLARACLLSTDAGVAPCWADTPLALHPDVLWWLWADGAVPPRLPSAVRAMLLPGTGAHRLVVVAGPDRTRRLQAVGETLTADVVLVAPLPEADQEWDALVRCATLAGSGIAVEVTGDVAPGALDRVDAAPQLPWAVCSAQDLPVDVLPRTQWHAAPVAPPAATPAELARVLDDPYAVGDRLTADQLGALAVVLPAVGGEIHTAVRRLAAGGIGRLAQRVVPARSWDDLVLPEPQADQVRHLIARARHRDLVYGRWGFSPDPSRGVVALFSGPSGTGKTLTAEVVAGEIGLDVYRVDLSQIVDKYVGETEKNLGEAFEAAAANPVVLFFDEADAVLGRRSAVQDSHDRYANLQVAFLLQRLERHDGVVLLASNLPGNLDPAFTRRLHVHVEFPLPGPAERRRIWQRTVPPQVPRDDVDLDVVAERFEMSGGLIRNAAQTAAFLAAEAGIGLTTRVLEQAVRRELVKDGRWVREDDFPSRRDSDARHRSRGDTEVDGP